MASAKITPTLEYAHAPSFPPMKPKKYPCQLSQDAKVLVTNPHPTIVATPTQAIELQLTDP